MGKGKKEKKEGSSEEVSKDIKKQPSGRPKKVTQKIEDQQGEKFWFQNLKCVAIVEQLGCRGQILFKCLSGQTATELKAQFANQAIKYEDFKKKRQDFSEFLTVHKADILEPILNAKSDEPQQHSQEQKQITYFFIGRNTDKETNLVVQDMNLQLLKSIIHPDFFQTFNEILQFFEDNMNGNRQNKINQFYDFQKHKHLVSWALIISWGRKGRETLAKLQSAQQVDSIQELMNSVDRLKEEYKTEDISNQEQLLQKYRREYEKEIEGLIENLFSLLKDGQSEQMN